MHDAADQPEDPRTATYGGHLSPAEELRTAIGAGQPVRRGGGEPAARGHGWDEQRQLPADLLYELLARPEDAVKPRAAVLVGLRITGRLNLESADLQAPLIAHNCHFDAPVNLIAAKAPEIILTACDLPALAADQLEIRGTLDLSESTLAFIGLMGAHIGGRLDLSGAALVSRGHPPDLGDGTLRPPERPTETGEGLALRADGMRVDQDMLCSKGFSADRTVRLPGARVGGELLFSGATLQQGLNADRLQVDQGVAFGEDFTVEGAVENFSIEGPAHLRGAHIGGQLSFNGARLAKGLDAEGLKVDREMFCGAGFTADDTVRLPGAHIGGPLSFDGASLNEGLYAEGLQVDQDVYCRKGFVAAGLGVNRSAPFSVRGEVTLDRAHIGGSLWFDGAILGDRLSARGLQVDGGMFCQTDFTAGEVNHFVAAGEVNLFGAHIGGALSFDGARLADGGIALDLAEGRVDGELSLRFAAPPTGRVDLTDAHLGSLSDSELTWPAQLRLRGCVYAGLEAAEDLPEAPADVPEARGAQPGDDAGLVAWLRRRLSETGPPDVQRRLRWIRRAEDDRGAGYAPSPYTQLMTFYRHEGRDRDAREVAYQRERRRRGELGLPGRTWSAFLQWTVGYGYKPLRALVLLIALVLVGSLVFSSFHTDGQLTAAQDEHPPFVASIYTLDRLIPVVSLGLRDAFAPGGAAQWWAFAYTLVGWMLTLAVVAGVNAAVRRDQ